MEACTSCAAASMFRSSANCTTICVCPRLDVDVMLSMPAIVEKDFSSGVATVAAIVCGAVPGSVALTVIVGKSTLGRSLTGSSRYATSPKTRMATTSKVVITGRLMKIVVRSTAYSLATAVDCARAGIGAVSSRAGVQRRPNHACSSSK